MKKIFGKLTLMLFLSSVTGHTDESQGPTGPPRALSEPVLSKALPADYDQLQRSFRGDHGLADAQAALILLSKAKALFANISESSPDPHMATNAHRAAWRLCLKTGKDTVNREAKSAIMQQWNLSLKGPSFVVAQQCYALSESWDRGFLTSEFWQLFDETKDESIISAIAYLFYQCGEPQDAQKLAQKRRSGIAPELQQIVQNAINWMKYKQAGGAGKPGPAAAPPRMR